jgi:hypothetical protein
MVSPNAQARNRCQGTPASRSLSRLKNIAPKHYAPPVAALPITSGGTTAIAKGGDKRRRAMLAHRWLGFIRTA